MAQRGCPAAAWKSAVAQPCYHHAEPSLARFCRAFIRVDRALPHLSRCDLERSGSTGVLVLLQMDQVAVAWVGDSRLVMASADPSGRGIVAQQMTSDHKPDVPKEMRRIINSNGRVDRWVGGWAGSVLQRATTKPSSAT